MKQVIVRLDEKTLYDWKMLLLKNGMSSQEAIEGFIISSIKANKIKK